MPWLLPPVYYGNEEDRAKAIAEAESNGHRLVRDERNAGNDREHPHRLTFEGGWQRTASSSQVNAEADGAPVQTLSREEILVAKLRGSTATLQDVIEYLRLRDGL